LTPLQLHCATVPYGPDCQWEGGSYERIEAQNRRLLERHFAELEAEACKRDAAASLNHCSACGREDDLTDRANPTLCYPCYYERNAFTHVNIARRPDLVIPDDLSIREFLLRPLEPLAMAA
jgi:hypothetical protein